jgi:hypothetical protein
MTVRNLLSKVWPLTAPTAMFEASHWIVNGNLKSGYASSGAVIKAFFYVSKA